jgi:hypothetical protein
MKAIAPEEIELTIATEDTLRLIVDTTPALIHTGRPDGYLDFFPRLIPYRIWRFATLPQRRFL